MGLALDCFHKSLLLMYMYTRSSAQFNVNQFHTLLWTNEYEFQFCLHDDAEHTCTKMRWVMGANVHPQALIKSHHLCGTSLRK
jgi:hypothetical protein